MSKGSRILQFPIHPLLLVIFFVLHNYMRYYGLVSTGVAWNVLVSMLVSFIIVFFIFLWLTRGAARSSLLTTFTGIFFLFFGEIKDSLSFVPFLGKYIIILPLLLIILGILFYLVRKKEMRRTHLFLNLFLLLSIGIDLISLSSRKTMENKHVMVSEQKVEITPDTARPDIYYLLFDSYPGYEMLRKYMDFDNSGFIDSLTRMGFRVLKNPSSNYNRTVFSMASLLNFQYLEGGRDFSPIGSRHYNQALLTVSRSAVVKTLQETGYQFHNLSIFNITDQTAFREETFLNLPEETMLKYNTLGVRLKKDLLFHFITGKYSSPFIRKLVGTSNMKLSEHEIGKKDFNQQVIDSVRSTTSSKTKQPRFVYAHLYLPHPPFFYDEAGKPLPMERAVNDEVLKKKTEFVAYLKYTNHVALSLISDIQKATGNKAVIVMQSDHGYTDFEGRPEEIVTVFENFSAFYFPERNYDLLYDSMSNINTFPVIFNSCLGSSIPLKKDTSIFLRY